MPDNQTWLDRWRENRIDFHEHRVNRYLQSYLPRFGLPRGARVFVPLCGKALDMAWLAARGLEVTGVEISELAIAAFFSENALPYQREDSDRFVVYRSDRITLLKGDFFDLDAGDCGACDLIYDRAALIALPAEQRQPYCRHMLSILPTASKILLVTFEYDQTEMAGPPYAVRADEARALFGGVFDIQRVERNDILDERPRWRAAGLTSLHESAWVGDRRS